MSDSAAISAFNAAVDAGNSSRERDYQITKRLDEIEDKLEAKLAELLRRVEALERKP